MYIHMTSAIYKSNEECQFQWNKNERLEAILKAADGKSSCRDEDNSIIVFRKLISILMKVKMTLSVEIHLENWH